MAKAQPKTPAAKKVAASAAARRTGAAADQAGAGGAAAEPAAGHRSADKVALVVASPIRHDGRDYHEGDALSVDADTAVELLDAGVADFPPGTEAAAEDNAGTAA